MSAYPPYPPLNQPVTSRAQERGESLWPAGMIVAPASGLMPGLLPGASTLPVSEVFGPTLQGEGPFAGRAVQFVRLGGCNLACSWCDTPYTWDASRYRLRDELTMMTVDEILAKVRVDLPVVLSGGEPLIHQHRPAWAELMVGLWSKAPSVHVETNGTLAPNQVTLAHVDHFTVSPKLANAGIHKNGQDPTLDKGWVPLLQSTLPAPTVCLKVVVTDAGDVSRAVAMADHLGIPRDRVWVMPEGTTSEVLLARWSAIADAAAILGINATQRLHVLAWGDTKGT